MMPVASPIQPRRGPVQTLWLPRKPLLSTLLHPSPALMPSKDPSALLHFSVSEIQANVGQAASPGPSHLVPSRRLGLFLQ